MGRGHTLATSTKSRQMEIIGGRKRYACGRNCWRMRKNAQKAEHPPWHRSWSTVARNLRSRCGDGCAEPFVLPIELTRFADRAVKGRRCGSSSRNAAKQAGHPDAGAEALEENPRVDIVYAEEGKIGAFEINYSAKSTDRFYDEDRFEFCARQAARRPRNHARESTIVKRVTDKLLAD